MRITTVRSEGLAQLSYFVSSDGEAMIIDPRRDVDIYLKLAAESQTQITHVFETHRNEDYVIGSLEIKYHVPSVQIAHSKETGFKYGDVSIAHQDSFRIGDMRVTCLHTPGHTDDSICYLVADISVSQIPLLMFTGDTLFVGEVGRTDLVDNKKIEIMSRKLYNSLKEEILPLVDGIVIHPGHGAGSVCGGNIGKRDFSTLGYERINNPWLSLEEEDFVRLKLNQKLTLSDYFKHCERLNTIGPPIVAEQPMPRALDPNAFEALMEKPGHVVVDTRAPDFFVCGHIPGAINTPLKEMGQFVGWVLDQEDNYLLVLERAEDLEQARNYLLRVGFDSVVAYLATGMDGWYDSGKPRGILRTISLAELKLGMESGKIEMIDVRQPHEQGKEFIEKSTFLPLTNLEREQGNIDKSGQKVTMCPRGVRATVAASILKREGHENVSVALDGIKGWKKSGYPIKAAE
ncbi:MAG: rhodanese-like domain-containing protein [Candidatus Thorarchaeota archaeon]